VDSNNPHKNTRHNDGQMRPVKETTVPLYPLPRHGIHPFVLVIHVGNCDSRRNRLRAFIWGVFNSRAQVKRLAMCLLPI